jgi:hypothetical protein
MVKKQKITLCTECKLVKPIFHEVTYFNRFQHFFCVDCFDVIFVEV